MPKSNKTEEPSIRLVLHCDFEQRKEQYANDNEKVEYLITEVKHLKSSITAIRSELSAVSHRFTKLEAAVARNSLITGLNMLINVMQIVLGGYLRIRLGF